MYRSTLLVESFLGLVSMTYLLCKSSSYSPSSHLSSYIPKAETESHVSSSPLSTTILTLCRTLHRGRTLLCSSCLSRALSTGRIAQCWTVRDSRFARPLTNFQLPRTRNRLRRTSPPIHRQRSPQIRRSPIQRISTHHSTRNGFPTRPRKLDSSSKAIQLNPRRRLHHPRRILSRIHPCRRSQAGRSANCSTSCILG